MTGWLDQTLRPLRSVAAGVAVVLDEDQVVNAQALAGEVVEVDDWWALRRAYERLGRRRDVALEPLVLLVQGGLATRALPWDIEQASSATVTLRLPGPPAVRAALAAMADDEEANRAIAAVLAASDPVRALLQVVTGVHVDQVPLPVADQLRVGARLAVRGEGSQPLAALARSYVTDARVGGLLLSPPDPSRLQAEWDGYVGEGDGPLVAAFEAARNELAELFAVGLLERRSGRRDLPSWADVGVRVPTDEEKAADLLGSRPAPFPPTDTAGWVALAEWWGQVRRLVAAAPPDLKGDAWAVWAEIDEAFGPWLRSNLGSVLSSSARWPAALHGVAGHLARRMREGKRDKVLLVVLDGLGHAQWAHLREYVNFEIVESGSTFAMVPTYTTVSRQAIFAGDLPRGFADTLWATSAERRRWEAFWDGEGVTGATYHRKAGYFPYDRIEFGASRAVGVVVNAVDDLMHSSELLGDAQLQASLAVWVRSGYLDDLVARGANAGYEVWITSDHGNLECLSGGARREGLGIDSAGKRLLRYPSRVLRDCADAAGVDWNDIPGMPPAESERLRFAPGRMAFTNLRLSVSHGGLSIDEVIVPLARVTA